MLAELAYPINRMDRTSHHHGVTQGGTGAKTPKVEVRAARQQTTHDTRK
jgi:hypothetical protein